VAVREIISSTLVNTGKYNIVERSMLDKIMKEQQFSNSDAVDDSQATELGRLTGASKVILSVVTLAGGRNMLSIKVIDVKTATVDQQKTKVVSTNELLDIIEPLTLELIGETNTAQKSEIKNNITYMPENLKPASTPVSNEGNITLHFAGFSSKKNPDAKIYVDNVLIGNGTLNEGFSVSFPENSYGKRNVTIEWDSVLTTKDYSIDTKSKKRFVFEYVRGGFGYEFKLKN
jgi:hypothetical protein